MVVEVRLASAHDYEVVPGEGDLSSQKTIPKLESRLHGALVRHFLPHCSLINVQITALIMVARSSITISESSSLSIGPIITQLRSVSKLQHTSS